MEGQASAGTSLRTPARQATEPLVGRVGDSYDNALAESVIGLYKTEVIAGEAPPHMA